VLLLCKIEKWPAAFLSACPALAQADLAPTSQRELYRLAGQWGSGGRFIRLLPFDATRLLQRRVEPLRFPGFLTLIQSLERPEALERPNTFRDHALWVSSIGRVLHNWDLATKKMLLQKAYTALPVGGKVIVYKTLIDDDRCHHVHALLQSLNMLVMTEGGFGPESACGA
jgi:hypothetical protein